jgi:predicted DNA-binding transcriptional regulator AlpA
MFNAPRAAISGETTGKYAMKRMLHIKQAAEYLLLSNASFYRLVAAGLLPPPIKLSPNRSAVFEHEVIAVIDARATGADDTAIKKLVANIVAARNSHK